MAVQSMFLEGRRCKEKFPDFLLEAGSHYVGQAGFTLEATPPASTSECWK